MRVNVAEPDYNNLLDYFPFEHYRPGQREILEKIQSHLLDPQIKQIIIEAPVGSGKSGYAITCARASQSCYVTTANKFLQQQYLRDFKDYLADLRGRANYECRVYPEHNCADSPCRKTSTSQSECAKRAECEYHDALKAASLAPITSFNFAAYLPFINFVKQYFEERNLLIVDEAHQIPGWISKFVEVNFSRQELMNCGLSSSLPDYESIDFYEKFVEQVDQDAKDLLKNENLDPDVRETCEKIIQRIYLFKKISDDENGTNSFALVKEYDDKKKFLSKVSFKPVVVSKIARDYLFRHCDKTIFLSATILDFDTFIELLGLDSSEVARIQVGSTFPKENRPFYTGTIIGSFNMRNIDQYLPEIVDKTKEVLDHYKDFKGIIHGNSYKICYFLNEYLQDKRILFPRTAADQPRIMEQHVSNDSPTVLLSPSMTEGVDLKEDASRFQVIVKMPFPYLGDVITKKRMEIYKGYYDMQTALTLVQAYGRSVRSESDWAHTYILDGQFINFFNRAHHMFPSWFREAIQ